jgi:tRNA (guanine37-N1)-methyltransferase
MRTEASIMKRAIDKGLVEVHFHNLRDYTTNRQKSVDDYPYGGRGWHGHDRTTY